MNVKFIDVAGTNVPNIPFVWYREEQILPTFEFCKFIDKDIFTNICNRIKLDASNLGLNDNTEFSISIQRHILSDVNLYISYHGYIYNKMTDDPNDDIVLDSKYNRDHRFSVKTITNNENVDFLHLSRDATVTGSVYIHDSAFSPPGNFHFRKTTDDTIYLVTEASCRDIPNQKIVSLFVIMNDKLKIEELDVFTNTIKIIFLNGTINHDVYIDRSYFSSHRLKIGGIGQLGDLHSIKIIGNKINARGIVGGLYAKILYDHNYNDQIDLINWYPTSINL